MNPYAPSIKPCPNAISCPALSHTVARQKLSQYRTRSSGRCPSETVRDCPERMLDTWSMRSSDETNPAKPANHVDPASSEGGDHDDKEDCVPARGRCGAQRFRGHRQSLRPGAANTLRRYPQG